MENFINIYAPRQRTHDKQHNLKYKNIKKDDPSCIICNKVGTRSLGKEFEVFLEKMQERVPEILSYSSKTVQRFQELMNKSLGEILDGSNEEIEDKVDKIMESFRYRNSTCYINVILD